MPREINGVWVFSAEETEQRQRRQRLAEKGLTEDICLRLSGFTDGEGCFSISRQTTGMYRCHFTIKLRADDRPILQTFKEATGLGGIYEVEPKGDKRHPQSFWSVGKKSECLELVDLFSAYPLWSKKARDFEIWSRAVELWGLIQPGERTSWEMLGEMYEELRAVRLFEPVVLSGGVST